MTAKQTEYQQKFRRFYQFFVEKTDTPLFQQNLLFYMQNKMPELHATLGSPNALKEVDYDKLPVVSQIKVSAALLRSFGATCALLNSEQLQRLSKFSLQPGLDAPTAITFRSELMKTIAERADDADQIEIMELCSQHFDGADALKLMRYLSFFLNNMHTET